MTASNDPVCRIFTQYVVVQIQGIRGVSMVKISSLIIPTESNTHRYYILCQFYMFFDCTLKIANLPCGTYDYEG